ncbi:MAG: ABC transporter substrate-binding protein [Candidatus Eremiobacter antarcticus]|nr:extracellular solute-binding protein [Candidatus Eremiobacteraeota bacterium]
MLLPCGCAQRAASGPLRVWSFNHFEGYEGMLKAQLAEFERRRPGFTTAYEIISWAEEDDKLTVAMASGRPPDVLWGALDPRWLATGLQVPIDDQLTAFDRRDFYDTALEAMRFSGRLWGFPLYQTLYCMAGNAHMFEDASVSWRAIQSEGWPWDRFLSDCRALKAPGVYPFVFFVRPTPEMWSWFALNNGVVDANSSGLRADGSFGWNRTGVAEALQFLIDTFRRHGISPPQEPGFSDENQTDLFFTGRAAVSARQGPYVLTEQKRIARAQAGGARLPHPGYRAFPLALLPFPHHPATAQRAHAGGGGYMVFRQKNVANPRRVEAAVRLAHFLSNTDGMQFAAHLSLLPSRRSGVRRFGGQLDLESPNMRFFQRYLQQSAPRIHPPLDVASSREARVLEVAVTPNWEAALAADKTVPQAMSDMTAGAASVLNGT